MPSKREALGGQQPELYEIRVRGLLGPTLLEAFPNLTAQVRHWTGDSARRQGR